MIRLNLGSSECDKFLEYAKAKSIELINDYSTATINYVLQSEPYSAKLVYEKYNFIRSESGEMDMKPWSCCIEFDSQCDAACFKLRWS